MTTPSMVRLLRKSVHSLAVYLCITIVSLSTYAGCVYAQQTDVVVNDSVYITSLSQAELRKIFTGHRQYWDDGKKINVFVLEDDAELHTAFCREQLQMFPYQLSRLWTRITYSGQGVTPKRVASQDMLIDALENTDGAIGYIEKGMIGKFKRIEVKEQ